MKPIDEIKKCIFAATEIYLKIEKLQKSTI